MERQTKKPFTFRRVTSMMIAAVMAATTCITAVPATAYAEEDTYEAQDIALGATSEEWDGTVASGFAGGTGTKSDPYQIANGQQLAYLRKQVNSGESYAGKYFTLTADILLNDDVDDEPNSWTPIGYYNSSSSTDYPFCGTFDGANHKVIGVYINDSSNNGRGLFGYIGEGGVVKNVGVTDGRMVCTRNNVGGICGFNYYGTISNCYNANKITSSSTYSCYGGVCGYNNGGTVEDCYNIGEISITGSKSYIGGVCGASRGTIKNCYNTGKVNTTDSVEYVGGVCGGNFYGTVSDSYNTGVVNGYRQVGGVCGYNEVGTVKNCNNSGEVTGRYNYVGGICGFSSSGKGGADILYCYNTGTIRGTNTDSNYGNTGGICGYIDGYLIKQCYNAGSVNGCYSTGGVCGYVNDGEIRECYNSGTVSSSYDYIGGVAGNLYDNTIIENCYNIGTIKGKSYVGGVWGYSDISTNAMTNYMTNCYNAGNVSGTGTDYIRPVGYVKGQFTNVYYDSDVCSGFDTDNNSWARTTKQLTAATALADLGFDSTVWSKKTNTSDYLYYPDLAAFDNDEAYVFIGKPKPKITGYKVGDYQVKLEWTALEGAEMYRIYTYENGTYTRRFTCDGNRNIATVTGLEGGKEYGFVVSAKVDGAWTDYSDKSDLVYATPTGTPKPAIVGYKVGNYKVKLEWKAVEGAEMYRVYTYENGVYTRKFTCLGSRNIATVTGLVSGTNYGFVVSAKVDGVWTDYSNAADLVYATSTGDPAPVITGYTTGDSKVKLAWYALEGAEMYRVYSVLNGVYTRQFTTYTSTTATVTGLENGTEYGFVVSAKVDGTWTPYNVAELILYATPNA